jgi:NitT/TauT family transport system substrate-binding protein
MMTRAIERLRNSTSWTSWRAASLALLLLAVALGSATRSANAEDLIRVGKASAGTFAFAPIDVGTDKGIWAKHGLKVKWTAFGGDAKLQQAMVADAIDFALGSGPGMGFIAKGVPALAVAAIANQPLSMGLTVRMDSSMKKPEDLKGATVSVSTSGSLTYWLTHELSRRMGWGPNGIKTVPLGTNPAQVAALKAGNVQGIVCSSSVGFALEKRHQGRVVVQFGDYIKDFHTHVVFATDKVMNEHPDIVRRFLAGWIEVIDFMAANRDETIKLVMPVSGLPEDIQTREYDTVMPMMSRDLRFKPKALAVLARSFTELHILKTKPDMSKLYTEKFLPTKK